MRPKYIIRADASSQIGSGHVMRCMALAEALRGSGADVHFVCRAHPGNLNGLIRERGFGLTELAAPILEKDFQGGYTNWLGVAPEEDAKETLLAVGADKPDWLIVDHYALNEIWESRIRPFVGKIMVIDDLADRRHDCCLLLDQNYEDQQRYANLTPASCRHLLGPHYALLRPEYSALRDSEPPRNGQVKRVLIFFGGTDPYDLTGLSLKVLSEPEFCHLELDIVIGSNYSRRDHLIQQSIRRGKTLVHSPRPHLADLMAVADLAIGAGGVTNWERLCMGLPSIVIAVAENQLPISEELNAVGAIRFLGSAPEVGESEVKRAFVEEIQPESIVRRSRTAAGMCDGRGLQRVVQALQAN